MRLTPFKLLCVLLISSGVVGVLANAKNRKDGRIPGRLVVHEWGTFTNFSGSDGVKLDFRPLVKDDLPDFVLDRSWQAGIRRPFSKSFLVGRQRMETPVTYFYTDGVRDINVQVGFPKGLLTEFYPPVKQMLPAFDVSQFVQQPPLGKSALNWGRVTLIPPSALRSQITDSALAKRIDQEIIDGLLPDSSNCPHYAHARETDSAIVHVKNPPDSLRPRMPAGNFFEKFLFYRGVGNFDLPLKLTCESNTDFLLTNNGADEVRSLFLVSVDGTSLRFQSFGKISAGQSLTLQQSKHDGSMDDLCKQVVTSLTNEGLYEKEAWAMVKTWRDSWFGEQGTRLFYVVPSAITEELLPLNVKPQPNEIVRVLIGRMEIMTPEAEANILQLVRESRQQRAAYSAKVAEAAKQNHRIPNFSIPPAILELGRFAEPALLRVIGTSEDAGVRAEARSLLRDWRAKLNLSPPTPAAA